jgi:hypothetical protein
MRELDKWIAREVFGYKATPGFTTNIQCSWMILDKFRNWKWKIEKLPEGFKTTINDVEYIDTTPALSICQATYLHLERKKFNSEGVENESKVKETSPKYIVGSSRE